MGLKIGAYYLLECPMKIVDLIKYIVWYSTQRDIKLTTIRLVKFIYLADLHYARANAGKTLTGLSWAFVYYGPYCTEVMNEIDVAVKCGVDRKTCVSKFQDGKDYALFSCYDAAAEYLTGTFPPAFLSPLLRDIQRYGEDTPALLDYVYFDTEPMKDVRKGDLLDFSKAVPITPPTEIKIKSLSKEQIEQARQHIRTFGEKIKQGRKRLEYEAVVSPHDDVYEQAISFMDGEDLNAEMHGIAHIVE
jgi:hypothetical protein